MRLNYTVYGEKPVSIVIEMGLGSCLGEWIPVVKQWKEYGGILIYERAGVNKSCVPDRSRTPENIATELFDLLSEVEHEEQVTLVAHSQGGLYATKFCIMYPKMVKKLILLDPLSPRDNEFKEKLDAKEFKKSGVDKSINMKIMRILARCKLGFLSKGMLRKAPPFYYYADFTKEETEDILGIVNNVQHMSTVLEEYKLSHEEEFLKEFSEKENFPDIPLVLITHSSELAIQESMKFGNNTEEFAAKVESMWQDIMKEYLTYSDHSTWIQAGKSTHYIHLQEPELVEDYLK